MQNKTVVPGALDLAERVAKVILDYSFRMPSRAEGVHDVMLFGSTLKGEGHDIDMLVIHNLDNLRKLGFFTTYNEKTGEDAPDLVTKIEDHRYRAEFILDSMGAQKFEAFFGYARSIMSGFRMTRDNWRIEYSTKYPYSGSVHVPSFGEVPIKDAENYQNAYEQVETYVTETLKQDMALERVKKILEERYLDLNSTLDLHVMHRNLLHEDRAHDQRDLAIQQSRDPTFWPSVLESGRLYNPETGHFDMKVDDKYQGAVELFQCILQKA